MIRSEGQIYPFTEAKGGQSDVSLYGQSLRLGQLRKGVRVDTLYAMPSGVHPASPMFPGFIGRVGTAVGFSVPTVSDYLPYMGQMPLDAQPQAKTKTYWEMITGG